MTRLVAVAAPELFAAALNRPWPDDLDGRVRCLDEGARALGLAMSCAPWSPEAEDRALAAEIGLEPGPVSAQGPGLADLDAEAGRPARAAGSAPSLDQLDAVTAGLTGTPGGLGVLGAVSGPAAWSARVEGDPEEGLDAASDLAAARVRALGACGVGRVAVVEAVRPGLDPDRAAEAHEPILRTAEHLRLDIFLIADPAADAPGCNPSAAGATGCDPARLGYERWVSPGGCSEGLAFLSAGVFESFVSLDRCFDERQDELAEADEAVTASLGPNANPAAVRAAAVRLAELADREPSGSGGCRERPR